MVFSSWNYIYEVDISQVNVILAFICYEHKVYAYPVVLLRVAGLEYLAYSGILNGPISFNIIIRTIGYLYGQATLIKLTAIK